VTDLLYDGSFDGFLCALALLLREKPVGAEPPRIVSLEERTPDLFAVERPVATDRETAEAFRDRFTRIAGPQELETLLMAHASADPRRHRLIAGYACLTLEAGRSVAERAGTPEVFAVLRLRDRVAWEIGKLMGFIRFRKAGGGLWYAPVRPEANVVGFLGPHFSDRFPDARLLIHDTGRGIGWRAEPGAGGLVDLRGMPERLARALERDTEPLVQSQWRVYFRSIAIPERRNPRLQDRNMPRRLWRDLVEEPRSAGFGITDQADGVIEKKEGDVRSACPGCSP
jgi:probable DNA metabolism protein